MSLRLDLIIRTSKRKKDAQSPRQQEQAARALEARTGHRIALVHDSGRSESGKTLDRESIRQAKARIAAGDTDGILVAYLDRLGRAPIEESMTFARGLHNDGGVLIACDWSDEPIDLTNPDVEDMLVFRLQINRSMWNKTKQRMVLTQTGAVNAGKYIGAAVKGYDSERGRLIVNDDASFMHDVFTAVGSGSYRPALTMLRRRWPNESWDTDRLRKLLRSPAYKGWSVSGELVNKTAHDAIVTEAEWNAAQIPARERRTNGRYPLSSVAVTPDGAPMLGQFKPMRGRRYRYLRAPGVSVPAAKLEDHVLGLLKVALANDELRALYVPGDVETAQRAVERARAEVRAFMGSNEAAADPELFDEGLAARNARLVEARAVLGEIRDAVARFEALPAAVDLLFERDECGHPVGADAFEKAIAVTIDRVVVSPGRGPVEGRARVVWRHRTR